MALELGIHSNILNIPQVSVARCLAGIRITSSKFNINTKIKIFVLTSS